jgi:hypothetical protein
VPASGYIARIGVVLTMLSREAGSIVTSPTRRARQSECDGIGTVDDVVPEGGRNALTPDRTVSGRQRAHRLIEEFDQVRLPALDHELGHFGAAVQPPARRQVVRPILIVPVARGRALSLRGSAWPRQSLRQTGAAAGSRSSVLC